MEPCGLYIIKDQFFEDFKDYGLLYNKNQARPHYYALKDPDGILWMIPLSSQIENCRKKIERDEARRGRGNCIRFHIGIIAGKEEAFKICDMIPVDESYIEREWLLNSIPYVVRNDKLNRKLYSKAMRYLKLVEQGQMHNEHDILGIKRVLLNRKKNAAFVI